MAVILGALGYAIGYVITPEGGLIGLAVAGAIWVGLWLTAVSAGAQMFLSAAKARELAHDDSPRLDNIVEEMTIAAGLPAKPKIYVIDSDVPNAFAVGRPEASAIAVTTGLLMRLNRDELQGVVAHEIGHISNQDTRFMVLAGVMVGAIVLLADVLWRVAFGAGRGQRRSSSSSHRRGGGQAMAVIILVAVALAILAPLLARLLYFACSRKREYLADASAAVFTRYPPGLASALEKIGRSTTGELAGVNRVTAPMYTVNPLRASGGGGLFGTHPPTAERVRVLRAMAGGAGYADYQAACKRTTGHGVIGQRTLHGGTHLDVRDASAAEEPDPLARAREAVDILHRRAGYLFLDCPCGLKLKIPPSFKEETLFCPRCSRRHAVAVARPLVVKPEVAPGAGAGLPPLEVRRQGNGWQSFRCACGQTLQVSPSFSAPAVRCRACGREIRLKASDA